MLIQKVVIPDLQYGAQLPYGNRVVFFTAAGPVYFGPGDKFNNSLINGNDEIVSTYPVRTYPLGPFLSTINTQRLTYPESEQVKLQQKQKGAVTMIAIAEDSPISSCVIAIGGRLDPHSTFIVSVDTPFFGRIESDFVTVLAHKNVGPIPIWRNVEDGGDPVEDSGDAVGFSEDAWGQQRYPEGQGRRIGSQAFILETTRWQAPDLRLLIGRSDGVSAVVPYESRRRARQVATFMGGNKRFGPTEFPYWARRWVCVDGRRRVDCLIDIPRNLAHTVWGVDFSTAKGGHASGDASWTTPFATARQLEHEVGYNTGDNPASVDPLYKTAIDFGGGDPGLAFDNYNFFDDDPTSTPKSRRTRHYRFYDVPYTHICVDIRMFDLSSNPYLDPDASKAWSLQVNAWDD